MTLLFTRDSAAENLLLITGILKTIMKLERILEVSCNMAQRDSQQDNGNYPE